MINHIIVQMINHRRGILEFIRRKKVITIYELAKHLKISWNTAEKYLLELVIENKIIKIKKERLNLWMLK